MSGQAPSYCDVRISLCFLGYGGPSFLYRSYLGDVPFNAMMDWLSENNDLLSLVKQAFRYDAGVMEILCSD